MSTEDLQETFRDEQVQEWEPCMQIFYLEPRPPALASDDLSGRWRISYIVQSSSPNDGLAECSVARWSEKDSTLQGRATLGNRGDGHLIGYCMESSFRAAITFRHNPTMFVQLTGSRTDGEMRGSFNASSSESGFWKRSFKAIQLTTGTSNTPGMKGTAEED